MLFLPLFRAFEDLQVFWRVTFSKAALTLVNNGVNLTKELAQTSGTALCRRGEILCALAVDVQDDEVREAPGESSANSLALKSSILHLRG